jgi:hypothetical protein
MRERMWVGLDIEEEWAWRFWRLGFWLCAWDIGMRRVMNSELVIGNIATKEGSLEDPLGAEVGAGGRNRQLPNWEIVVERGSGQTVPQFPSDHGS